MKIAFTSLAAATIALAQLTGAQAAPIARDLAGQAFESDASATLLRRIQDEDDYGRRGDRWRYRRSQGDFYGPRRYDDDDEGFRPRYGERDVYGRPRYRGDEDAFGGRGEGMSAHERRLRIIWCTQHPGRC